MLHNTINTAYVTYSLKQLFKAYIFRKNISFINLGIAGLKYGTKQ